LVIVESLEEKKLKLLKEIHSDFPLIINLSNQKGGVGKSTLAYNIADAFRILGFKVKLLDIDVQNTCSNLNNLREKAFRDIIKISDEKQLIEFINNSSSDGSEILVIDTGSLDSPLLRLAIIGADINITPISDRVTEILSLVQKYSQILVDIERDTNISTSTHVILNKIHPFAKHFEHIEEIISYNPKMKILKQIVRDRDIYDKSFIDGKTVFEASDLKGYEKASNDILSICYELIEIHININKG